MIENDNIRDLFSRTLESHTTPVRPEVWNGLQAKMAVAGVSSVAGAKGISALAKWLIGSAAVSVATVTTIVLVNTQQGVKPGTTPAQQEIKASVIQQETAETLTGTNFPAQPSVREGLTPSGSQVVPGSIIAGPTTPESGILSTMPFIQIGHPCSGCPGGETASEGLPPGEGGTPPSKGTTTEATEPSTPERITDNNNPSIPELTAEENPSKIILIPNTFTPNGDGDNDFFHIQSENLSDFTMMITDAKGIVWSTQDPNFQWNGELKNGEWVTSGMYSVTVMARDTKGKPIRKFGEVHILR